MAVPLTTGDVRWLVRADYRDLFIGPDGLRLAEWLADGHATVVKQGPHRIVYRVDLSGVCCYVKHNLNSRRLAWIRRLLRPGKAWSEYRRALAVAARGVPTIEPLAVGVQWRGPAAGESFLVTRSLDETVQLNYFIEAVLPWFGAARQTDVRCRLARELGAFIARLHNAGIVHNDLHCGNILIRLDELDRPSLFLIDLQTVQLGRPLRWGKSRSNLVMLNRWLMLRASRTDRHRFWRAYLEARDWRQVLRVGQRSPDRPEATALQRVQCRGLETATRLSNRRFWRRRERRCFEVTRHTRRLGAPGLAGFAVTDLDPELVRSLLADPDAPFRTDGARLLKNSRSAAVVELSANVGGVARQVVWKRFAVTQRTDPLAAVVRRAPAVRSWLFGHAFTERGLPTARPLAFFHRLRWGLCHEGYFLMEKVDASGDLHTALATLETYDPIRRRRLLRHRIDQLAWMIRELHLRHLAHRDLKAANILLYSAAASDPAAGTTVDVSGQNDLPPFCFIDLVGVSGPRRLSRRVRVKNLSRLHASFRSNPEITRTDKLRFLRIYLQWGIFGRQGWKDWWRAIEQATLRKVRKNLRNQRPLS